MTERDDLIKRLKEKWKLQSDPPVSRVTDLIYKYSYTVCVDAVNNSDPKAKTWNGILNYVQKVAKTLSAAMNEISGEKLDLMEREYRDMVYSLEEAIIELEAGKKDLTLTPGDEELRKKLEDGQKWIDKNQRNADALAGKIKMYGGNTDVRR